MKKFVCILCALALLLTLGACKARREPAPAGTQGAEAPADGLRLRLVTGAGTGQLVLAGEQDGAVYTAAETGLTVYLDGAAATVASLKNGMLLTLGPDYEVLETYPGQLTNATVYANSACDEKTDHGDLCGLYLQVLEDLWEDDSGLNGDIRYISVDLADAPGALTDGEKAAIAWVFAGRHGAQPMQLGFAELKAQGYINTDELYWEDGLLFRISQTDGKNSSEDELVFDAQKWRSGLGAIFYLECTAKRGDGVLWQPYEAGSFAIS